MGGKRGPRSPQQDVKSPPKKAQRAGKKTPPKAPAAAPTRSTRARGGGAAGGGGGRVAAVAGIALNDSSQFPDPAASRSPTQRSRGLPSPGATQPEPARAVQPEAVLAVQPRSPRSQARFEAACLPLRPDAPGWSTPSRPAQVVTAADLEQEVGRFDDEMLPADGMASPPRYDDAGGVAPRAAPGAAPRAAAPRRPPVFSDAPAVEQLQRKPHRPPRGRRAKPWHRPPSGRRARVTADVAALNATLPPAGATPADPPDHEPGAYANSKPQTRTRVIPLKSSLQDAAMVPVIKSLVMYTSFIVFHVYGVLEYHAARLAADAAAARTPQERDRLLREAALTVGAEGKGQLFDKTVVYEVLGELNAYAKRRGEPKPPPPPPRPTKSNPNAAPYQPPRLQRAIDAYMARPKIAAEFAKCIVPAEATAAGLRAQAANIVAAFKRQFDTGNRQLQKRLLREVYETSGKEAKKLHERLGLAAEEELKLAKNFGAFEARKVAYEARRALEAAERDVNKAVHKLASLRGQRRRDAAAVAAAERERATADASQRAKQVAFDKAEEALKKWAGKLSDAEQDAALDRLRNAPLPARSRRKSATGEDEPDDRPSLLDVLNSERDRLPKTLRQDHQLLYRADIMRRLAAAGKEVKGNLTPRSEPDIKFMYVEMPTLEKLLDGKMSGERKIGDNTINGRLGELLKPEVLKHARKGWPAFGFSFKTDGEAVHLSLVNEAALADHLRDQKAQTAGIASRAKGEVKMEVSDDEAAAPEHVPNTTLKSDGTFAVIELGPEIVLTTLDPAFYHAVAAARLPFVTEEQLLSGEPLFTPADSKANVLGKDRGLMRITAAAFRHMSGQHQRREETVRLRNIRIKNDPEFAATVETLKQANSISTADPDQLLSVLEARGSVFYTMAKDGFRRARARFHAYTAERSLLHRIGVMLLPASNYRVAFGDAKLSARFNGPGTKVEHYVREHWPSQVLPDVNENRTSMLCSTQRCVMAHPPQCLMTSKTGKRYIKRVYGLYMCVMPGFTVLWNRDTNAPINMQVRFWHEYHFGVAPKEFLRTTPKSDLVLSKACSYTYTWLADKGCFKRTIDTNTS